MLSINARNTSFGVRIPYYIWIGRAKETSASATDLAEVDAAATESPFLQALDSRTRDVAFENAVLPIHSKAYECAIVNLTSSLPLPASWYQNNHWRVYFDAAQAKHRRFNDEYIYSFTWEDSRVDARLLKIKPDDVILALTSAGDNILSYALEGPKRIHAVDLK